MKLIPQIRLRTFFLIFFCAAVGLTCATAPKTKDDALAAFNFHVPQLNWYYALLTAAATAMVIGLMQQMWSLIRRIEGPARSDEQLLFARTFAIGWRVLIALTISICLAAHILISRQIISLPDHTDLFFNNVFPENLLLISVIVVLIDSVRRWQQNKRKVQRAWIDVLAAISGLLLALLVLPDSGLITYLVHIATQGIERAGPVKFQRPGVFPDQEHEHFRAFWLSLGAVVSIVLAATILSLARFIEMTTKRAIALGAVYLGLLAAPAAFCVWFYASEFSRISPDMASAGFACIWFDWFCSGTLVAIFITTCSYRLAICKNSPRTQSLPNGSPIYQEALHESALCLLLLFGAAVIYFEETVHQFLSQSSFMGPYTFLEMVAAILRYPEFYVFLAVTILSVQLCWVRWKRRHEPPTWQLQALDRRSFIGNWLALTLLSIVALPTIAIYCFAFWLGPWYLYGS